MAAIPSELSDVRDKLRAQGTSIPGSARELLSWFKAERRGPLVNAYIRAALDELRLVTEPDFETVNIDAPLAFKWTPDVPAGSSNGTGEAPTPSLAISDHTILEDSSSKKREDPTLRVRILSAAIRYPIVVAPEDPKTKATTLMLSKDFSQLPVFGNHKLHGAISWRSIGRRLVLGAKVTRVSECVEDPIEIRSDTPLLQAIELITKSDYALIIDEGRRLVGLVTTADVSREFRTLSEPFLLLREAENYIRNLLESRFSIQDLKQFRDPNIKREIYSVADLTLGEYLRALADDGTWAQLQLPVDRKFFVNSLDQIRSIRNDVMHFDPDPIESSRLTMLTDFVRLLQALGECVPDTVK